MALPYAAIGGEVRPDFERPPDAGGLVAVYSPREDAKALVYRGLQSIQHRGPDGIGIAVGYEAGVMGQIDTGKASLAFNNGQLLNGLPEGEFSLGHIRHIPKDFQDPLGSIQPVVEGRGPQPFALGEIGNLANVRQLLDEYNLPDDVAYTSGGLMVATIAAELHNGSDIETALGKAMAKWAGAYSLVLMAQNRLLALRDSQGLKPLVIGRYGDEGFVLASETPALDILGARFEREVEPGEQVVIDEQGLRSRQLRAASQVGLCALEILTTARPDSLVLGESIYNQRFRLGRLLAEAEPVEADVAIGIPDSATIYAQGYSQASGIPFAHGLIKNRYFLPLKVKQGERADALKLRFNPITEVVEGKSIVLVDDSIRSGTTCKVVIEMLRREGAKQVHVRIPSPPHALPCAYGVDTTDPFRLIASQKPTSEIAAYIGADSLAYLEVDSLRRGLGQASTRVCVACMKA